ncbi:MAG TPA: glycosyltransferase family 4 protein, partial [Ilumatobacteraceae bacterium]|nr:glycosyltransferase family 4 protein [Ilumatobacteraceae bacterium]
GMVAVMGDLAGLTTDEVAITCWARTSDGIANDGLAPGEADLLRLGPVSESVVVFGVDAAPALGWLGAQMVAEGSTSTAASSPPTPTARWLDRCVQRFHGSIAPPGCVHAVGWQTVADATTPLPVVVDLAAIDRGEPWHVSFMDTPARLRLSAAPSIAALVEAGWSQCAGQPTPLRLPGGIPVAGAVRQVTAINLVNHDPADSLPPEPFGPDHSRFVAWLESSAPYEADVGRYWAALRQDRADLQAAFPQPHGADAVRLRHWGDVAWRLEPLTCLLWGYRDRGGLAQSSQVSPSDGADDMAVRRPGGFNVLGYLNFDQSLGHIARRIVAALDAAGVGVAAINNARTRGAPRAQPYTTTTEPRFAANIVVANADQFAFVVADHGDMLRDRYTIGYWFWELDEVPPSMAAALADVDEVWTGSEFVADAFRRITNQPVHCMPLPVEEPSPSAPDRARFGVPNDAFVFVTTFDHRSVPERKNPFGAIEAFRRAFADGEGPVLWVKSINGDQLWRSHERVLLAAAGRSDIVVTDAHLSHADQMAVLAASDCLVSLHRSEGLGLHCAEAMWLGKPVIATRYSGNLDFMDDTCAALIDYTLTPVRHGEGVYPETSQWADPDLDQAAAWMRRLVADRDVVTALGAAARAKMKGQMSLAEAGHLMASRVGAASRRSSRPAI